MGLEGMRWRGRALTVGAALVFAGVHAAGAPAATLHVQSGAPAGGDGSAAAPFASLSAVQDAAGPGDTIVVVPVAGSTPALDGGIALKPGQRLMGGGPRVLADPAPAALPVITNRTTANGGNGVVLASGATVSNLVIRGTRRGGVYGMDTVGVQVIGNDVSSHNRSCTRGFKVQPFMIPTAVPYVGLGRLIAPQNGWAGIMVDGERATGSITIEGNKVHNSDCGDGIDIRAAGTSDLTVRVDDNHVSRLREGWMFTSVIAIGMQARDKARLTVTQRGNSQTSIGSFGADCEGQFLNTSQSGVIVETIEHNTFRRGIGGFSCNGLEAVVSNGHGSIDLTLRDSLFEGNPGDMLEQANLGAGSTMRWNVERIVARRTYLRGANGPFSSAPGWNPIPFNVGDCLLVGQNGGSNTTVLRMRDSVLEDCNNGISALSGFAFGNGKGKPREMTLDIARTRIANVGKYGVQIANSTPSREFTVRMEQVEVTGARGFGVAIDRVASARAEVGRFDLGGGVLGSAGGNCFAGNGREDLQVGGFAVDARGNWWGGAPRVRTRRGGTAATDGALVDRPACGPEVAPAG